MRYIFFDRSRQRSGIPRSFPGAQKELQKGTGNGIIQTDRKSTAAQALERKGIISDRCEMNRQIKADHALLRILKAQVKKLMQAVKNTLPALAEAMESLREKMIIFRYQVLHIQSGKGHISKNLHVLCPELEQYIGLVSQIKEKRKERKTILAGT